MGGGGGGGVEGVQMRAWDLCVCRLSIEALEDAGQSPGVSQGLEVRLWNVVVPRPTRLSIYHFSTSSFTRLLLSVCLPDLRHRETHQRRH